MHEAFFSDLTAHFSERVLLGCRASLAKPPIYLRLLACFSSSFGWSTNSELSDWAGQFKSGNETCMKCVPASSVVQGVTTSRKISTRDDQMSHGV